jgi:hypothetical protein
VKYRRRKMKKVRISANNYDDRSKLILALVSLGYMVMQVHEEGALQIGVGNFFIEFIVKDEDVIRLSELNKWPEIKR